MRLFGKALNPDPGMYQDINTYLLLTISMIL